MQATFPMPLVRGLVDDAGLFPPTRLTMPDALARHRRDEKAGHPVLTHRFLCPASRLGELRAELADADHLRLGLILDTGLEDAGARGLDVALSTIGADPRLALDLVEAPLPAGEIAGATTAALKALLSLPPDVAAYLEPQRGTGWLDAVAVLARHRDSSDNTAATGKAADKAGYAAGATDGRRGSKVRCGGTRPESFPSSAELAGFVATCAAAHVPFKATAGLHHAVRHTDRVTGFGHHGFLNLLVATGAAAEGADERELIGVLDHTGGTELAARARAFGAETILRTRALLVSYGSCSTDEPIEDLAMLGLIENAEG